MTKTKITFFSRSGKMNSDRSGISITFLLIVWGLLMSIQQSVFADDYSSRFQPVRPAHYIAVLANPSANSGNNAKTRGYWPLDPGPRGVKLHNYDELLAHDGVAPTKWQFDNSAWWLEENGLINDLASMCANELLLRSWPLHITG